MLKQIQQQKLVQRLSPQQIQFMRMLQVTTVGLEERIKEELEENPVLEYVGDTGTTTQQENEQFDLNESSEEESNTESEILSDDQTERIEIDNYLKEEDDLSGGSDYYGERDYDRSRGNSVRVEASLNQLLLDQLLMLDLDDRQQRIGQQIIGSIDSEGYLRRDAAALVDDLVFSQSITTSVEEVTQLIKKIQSFDPAGVGAQNLQECLLIQLSRQHPQTEEIRIAKEILARFFDEFTKKHYERIIRTMDLRYDWFKKGIEVIIKLNPRPGAAFGGNDMPVHYIVPDFFVENDNGTLEVTINSKNAPELRISAGYREMMANMEKTAKKNKSHKETVSFIKHKMDSAKWFIDSIKQRQYTLLNTMNAIVSFQRNFFLTGDEATLRPMILKDIANITEMDVSTISRVVNSKFVQTEYGIFSLKFFFSDGFSMENGEEVTNKEIKSILAKIIEQEDKQRPYQDEMLMEMLAEMGYHVARRTVAKYREKLNIPVARLRKKA